MKKSEFTSLTILKITNTSGNNTEVKIFMFNTLLLFLFLSSHSLMAQNTWAKILPGIGSFSSPRIADLNNDKVGDIILGAGRKEFQACDSAVVALNGKTGELLWKVHAKDQIFGSAALQDITGDGILDVLINGRSAELIAINGQTGKVLWRFIKPKGEEKEWFNFYNPQFIRDQNNDGQKDILISNGGDVLAEPNDPNRPTGHLVIINSKTGNVISKAPMPDGGEIYMSVSVLPHKSETFKNVIFGTGGETIGGNLYVTSISEIKSGDLSKSIKLATSEKKGFVGPGAWADINEDGHHDIIANSVDGRLMAFDGITHKSIWTVTVPDTEAYGSVAIGLFNDDNIPDVFVSYAQGVWPDLGWSKQIMVNGKNGTIEFEDTLGFYQMSSPVAVDLNNDGKDEALLPMNYQVKNEFQMKFFHNNIIAIEFTEKVAAELDLQYEGNNLSSTPWIGDLDGNGYLDIVYLHGTNVKKTYTFDGLRINRIDTKFPITGKIRWGSYMGSDYNGVFTK
ncbi:outer membrane protein assembly factor BamB family protein [Aureibaculum luteum]|uniref:outer membrane protein assembly factor BamB family protein n=1 Tax=Aureibaculum luteum TaxID=1548456 RepID=UPI000E51107F|nr:PQQ-binding-like beta-propeller repeat protein [Aureibaculum luteum]